MGWTSYMATYYKKDGSVDRKKEMDERWSQKKNDRYPELNVLKSRMVGSVYYAAIEVKRNGVREEVFGTVALTSTDWSDGMNFGYKDMDESMGPYCYDCPKSILDLLTETDNEHALEWRRKCRERIKKKKKNETKGTLPVGSVIEFKRFDDVIIRLRKMNPAYQFKRTWWYREEDDTYYPTRRIPDNFTIISKGDV